MVEAGAVRTDEPAGHKCPRSLISDCGPILIRILAMAQTSDHLVLVVENCHLAQQVRDHPLAAPFVQITRHLRRAQDEINVPAIQPESLQPAIPAVSYDQHRRLRTCVDPETMRTIDLVGIFPKSAEGANKLGLLVVLIDVAGSVPITNVNVIVRSDGYIRRPVKYGGSATFLFVDI